MKFKKIVLPFLIGAIMATSCGDDDASESTAATADFTVTIENVFEAKNYIASGVFDTPDDATSAGPATSGSSYSFTFYAGKGSYLSFATMFVQSNDLFYAPAASGIALYDDNGDPISGDMTAKVNLWDAGTEVNEEPYVGENQAPRQSGADTGTDENGVVQLVDDEFTYPADEDIIEVNITSGENNSFTVTINNISTGDEETPIAPGVFVIHSEGQTPLFEAGAADFGNGLEALAEDGGASGLGDFIGENTGYYSPFAPGVFAVHTAGTMPLFMSGSPDFGEGLEGLAEDGAVSALGAALEAKSTVATSGIFDTPTGAGAAGPLFPEGTYTFSFTASEGDYLSFATMLIESNDLFYSFGQSGIALFENGRPIAGDMTSQVNLWDAGTEENEYPGAGDNQPFRQSGPDSGIDEDGNVTIVDDAFTYPATTSAIKITISAE